MPQAAAIPLSAAEFAALQDRRAKARTFLRMVRAEGLATGGPARATDVFLARFPRTVDLDRVIRAAVSGGTSQTWGAPLAGDPSYAGAFLELLRPATVLGRMEGVRRVEPRTWTPRQTGGASAGWVAPGKAIKVSKGAFDRVTLGLGQLAAIVVTTNEVIEGSAPDAEAIFEADVRNAVIEATDRYLLDPAAAEVPDVSPASITHDAFTVASSGNDAAAVAADIAAIRQHMADAGIPFAAPYFITSTAAAAGLAGLRTGGGDAAFPDVSVAGGTLEGIPLLTSAVAGPQLVLVDASLLLLADDGIDVAASKASALELRDDPVGDVGAPTGAPLVSMFQTNSTAIRAVRYCWWELGQSAACAVVSDFTPGAPP